MKFEDIIGQEEVKNILMSEADRGRLPHALLLTGPEGCGKMPMALALAQYLCCTGKHNTNGQSSMFDEPSKGSNNWHILMCISYSLLWLTKSARKKYVTIGCQYGEKCC